MKTKEFDAHIRNKFEENDFEYKPGGWERLAWQMENNIAITAPPKKKKHGFLLISGIAASILLAVAIMFYPTGDEQPATVSAVSSVSDMATTTPPEAMVSHTPEPTTPEEIAGMEHIVRHRTGRQSIIPPSNIRKDIAATQTGEQETVTDNEQQETKQETGSTDINLMNAPVQKQAKKQYALNEYATYPEEKTTHRKIDLSLGGGYNYGSLGSGYTLNANMQKNLGAGFFIAGDVGIVNNSASNTTITQTPVGAAPPVTAGTSGTPGIGTSNSGSGFTGTGNVSPNAIVNAGGTTVPTVSVNNINLFYMQVTPMIGYKIGKKITVGAGADVQRLLQDKYDYVTDANGNVFAIPATDIGMTGKAEYTLSPRIQTGIQYRNGISNMLESGKNYLERDYFQVQIKCRISK